MSYHTIVRGKRDDDKSKSQYLLVKENEEDENSLTKLPAAKMN